ncbi:MAG: hypothetical protein WCS30_00275 [Selenomonadaceae bacterium]
MTNFEKIRTLQAAWRNESTQKYCTRDFCECADWDFTVLDAITEGGSEKQVAWANTIYTGFVKEFSDYAYKSTTAATPVEKVQTIFNKIFAINDAKYWIDHRTDTINDFIKANM